MPMYGMGMGMGYPYGMMMGNPYMYSGMVSRRRSRELLHSQCPW